LSTAIARLGVFAVALAAATVVAAGARADGLPVLGVNASQGVASPGGGSRYLAIAAGGGTLVIRVQRAGGRLFRSTFLPAAFTVPAVAYDGTPDGLSRDGRTLVLIRPRTQFPETRTTLAVLDAKSLAFRDEVTLRGDFSFDAISPRGRSLYLIHYVSARDPNSYEVRRFDIGTQRLLPKPIVDPHERGEAMRGSPITRATSPDGRWAYTLYDGAGMHPFVHALNISRGTARCIDLDALAGRKRLWSFRLGVTPDGRELTVVDRGRPIVNVDTRTFRVTTATVASQGGGSSGRPGVVFVILAAVGAAALAAAGLAMLRRRPRPKVPTPT
jgi:hypothetical protein